MDAGYVAGIFGLFGAFIGSLASIVSMIIQVRVRDKRDRFKQVTEIALAEYKIRLELVMSGKMPNKAILPLAAYVHFNDLLLRAIESGALTNEKVREIWAASDDIEKLIMELDPTKRMGPGA